MTIDTLVQNLKLAVRSLRRERSVAVVALGSLAIGIAANATIFSLLQAVEFPRLIYPQASRILFLESRNDARGLVGLPVSAPDALDVAAASRTLERASLTADQTSTLGEGTARTRVSGRRVAAGFFDVLRVPARRGRVLAASDGDRAIVLSDRLWRARFGADEEIVGRPIHLDGEVVPVVGIMPARFDLDADFWVPLTGPLASFGRDDRQFTLFARLAPGASIGDATRELADLSRRLAADRPTTNKEWTMFPTLLTRMHGRDSRGAFFLLQAAVAFVLLIACANIANILLARGTRRRHEIALCLSLGASRRRVLGQLLTESILLSMTGGAIGVGLAVWGIRLARTIGGFPDIIDPTLNVFVLAFTAALSITTGVLCGIVPALRASAVAPDIVLRAEGGRGNSGRTGGRLRGTLVAVQVASAVVLATGGALMLQSLANREHVDLGFDRRSAIRADLMLSGDRYRNPGAVLAAVDTTLERLARQPDVAAAGVSSWALPNPVGAQRPLTLPAEHGTALDPAVRRAIEAVTPRYLAALGARLTRGRTFTDADRPGADPVAIVNEELARRLWPDRNPVGERLRLGAAGDAAPVVIVVGVVSTIRRSAMHDVVVARVYVPFAQYPNATLTMVVRSRDSVRFASSALRMAVEQTDPALMLEGLRTVEDDLAQFVAPIRLMTSLLTGFGVTGLLLAALGVFGTMSYAVSQREREMAVRSALGADRRDLIRLVLSNGLIVTMAGLVPGAAAAMAAARMLRSFLFGVSPADPITLSLVVVAIAVVSLLACYRPARAAAAVDPMSILRT